MNINKLKKGMTVYVASQQHVMQGCMVPYDIDFMEAEVLGVNVAENTVTVLAKHAISMATVPCSMVFLSEQAGRDAIMNEMESYVQAFRKRQLDNYIKDFKINIQTKTESKTMKIKFKKLIIPDAKVEPKEPARATSGAAGFDMTAISYEETKHVKNGLPVSHIYRYHTGIALELPPGWTALVFPRSSIVKTGAMLGNSVGVVDSDYRGEITLCFKAEYPPYSCGDRIGQLVIVPVPDIVLEEAVELSETARGSGSYGSTGA